MAEKFKLYDAQASVLIDKYPKNSITSFFNFMKIGFSRYLQSLDDEEAQPWILHHLEKDKYR